MGNKRMAVITASIVALLVLTACNNEAKKNQKDEEELDILKKQIAVLYEPGGEDIIPGMSDMLLDGTYRLIEDADEELDDLSDDNKDYFDTIKEKHKDASEMYEVEVETKILKRESAHRIDDGDSISNTKANIQENKEDIQEDIEEFDDYEAFQHRMRDTLHSSS